MKQRAIRFEPKDHGHTMPLSTLVDALSAIRDGLESARRVTIKQLAAKMRRRLDVETLFQFEVGVAERGSYAVPLLLHRPPSELPLDEDCAQLFWPMLDGMIHSAVQGHESALPAVAALALAKASRCAAQQGATVEIAERLQDGDGFGDGRGHSNFETWTSVVPISEHEDRFRRYADRLSVEHETMRTIVGKLTEIRFAEPGITIDTGERAIRVRIHVDQKERARALGEQVVIAEIKGRAALEGPMRDPVLVQMHAAAVITDVRAHFAATKGPVDPHWNSAEAAEYFSNLRKSDPE